MSADVTDLGEAARARARWVAEGIRLALREAERPTHNGEPPTQRLIVARLRDWLATAGRP